MLGIVHLSPMTISVIIERSRFKREHIKEGEAKDGSWSAKVTTMSKQPKDGRERVLFVEKLAGLQAMLKAGFDASPFKIVLYDDLDSLKHASGITIVDAKHVVGETWKLYQMLPDEFNSALAATEFGVPATVRSFDPSVHETDKVPPPIEKKPSKKRGLAGADAVMAQIIGGVKEEAQGADEPPPPPKVTKATNVEQPVADPSPVEAAPEPAAPEPVAAEAKSKTKAKKAKPKKADPQPGTTDDTTKQKKPALESHKLF